MNIYEIVGFLTTILCVGLSAREIVWGFPVAAIASAFYAVVYYQSKLYLDSGLQVFFLVLSLYGWYEWLYGGKNKQASGSVLTQRSVGRLPVAQILPLLTIGLVATLVLGYAVVHLRPDASIPYLDAAMTAGSLVASWLLAKKYLENWLVWIALDPIYAGIYVYKELYLTAFLYLLITWMAIRGYQHWKKDLVVL